MISFRHHGQVAAVALLISAGSASADVTPAQVWSLLEGQMKAMGYDLQVETLSKTPDSLVLGDVTYTATVPDGGRAQVVTRGLRFDSDGKGGVTGDYSHMTMAVAFDDGQGQQVEAELALDTAGQEVQYTGDPGNVRGTYDWPLATFRLTALRVDGKPVDATGALTMHDASGNHTFTMAPGDEAPAVAGDMKIASVDLNGEGTVPDPDPGNWSLTGSIKDISVSGSGFNPGAMLGGIPKSGSSNLTYGAGDFTMSADGKKGALDLGAGFSSGFLQTSVEDGHLVYGTGNTGIEISVGGSMVPVSGTVFKLASTQSHMDLPLDASEKPQPFGISFNFDGIELADQIWAMFDPQATLSRDPATLSLNISGEAVLKQGLAEMIDNPESIKGSPGDLRSLLLDGLVVRVFGAELTADGNATFNPPSPMPVGSVDLHAKNITTVLQKLSALGLVDPSSAGMAQMMLGMYAKPGDGPDTWDSHIEMNEQGGVLVNGQPMQ